MNIEDLFDDIEATVENLKSQAPELAKFKPVGFDSVTFNRDHFAGFIAGTTTLRLTRYQPRIALVAGESKVSNETLAQAAERMTGLWVRIETGTELLQGKLLAVESRLLVFRDYCVPASAILQLEMHAVDNQIE